MQFYEMDRFQIWNQVIVSSLANPIDSVIINRQQHYCLHTIQWNCIVMSALITSKKRDNHTNKHTQNTKSLISNATYVEAKTISLVFDQCDAQQCERLKPFIIHFKCLCIEVRLLFGHRYSNISLKLRNVYLICNYLKHVMSCNFSCTCQNAIRFIVIIRRHRFNVSLDLPFSST